MIYPILDERLYRNSLVQQIIDTALEFDADIIQIPFEDYDVLCREECIKGVVEINGIRIEVI